MIRLKTPAEIACIRVSGRILAETLKRLKETVRPGLSTAELDEVARSYIEAKGAQSWFLGYHGFPASLCVAVNEEVIHGIPGRRRLQEGDIVGLDLGVNLDGYYSDASVTLAVGKVSPKRQRLIQAAEECLEIGLCQAVCGNRISDISTAIFEHARSYGFDVVRQYCGHGVGFSPHEEPQVPNYPFSGSDPRLKAGMVIAIEPMITAGDPEVEVLEDQWTVVTLDRQDSSHFEHTVAVFKDHSEILTALEDRVIRGRNAP